jgi:uncharacterized phage protein (TIGR02218 family)
MRNATGALRTFLADPALTEVTVADLLTLTLANGGGQVCLTNYDQDLVIGGVLYRRGPTQYARDLVKIARGLVADPINLTIFPDALDLLAGITWQAAAQQGVLDGARVSVDKLVMSFPGDTSLGTVNLFTGRIADVEGDRVSVRLTCKSDVELLDTPFPRNVYQANCAHTLFDSGCALSRAAFTTNTTVGAGSTAQTLLESALVAVSGYYDLGTVTMTSGLLRGQQRPIKAYTLGSPNAIVLMRPFPAAPALGDTMAVVPGCDKLQTTCTTKFANLAHFRGEPFIPAPEEAQ